MSIPTAPVALASVAMIAWGLWVVLSRLATETLSPEATLVVTYLSGAAVGGVYLVVREGGRGLRETVMRPGAEYAVLAGLCFGIGGLAYYAALQYGSVTVPTTIAALYFVVASLLAVVVFDEPVTLRQAVGICLAIGSVVLLST